MEATAGSTAVPLSDPTGGYAASGGNRFSPRAVAIERQIPQSADWMQAVEPPDMPELTGLAEQLRLDIELPAAIAQYPGRWVEYGVVEAAYAEANPEDFALLVAGYSHTAIAATRYSASAFIAATLGRLSRTGHVLFHGGPATGRWSYNGEISWWALPPEPRWEVRTSWLDLGRSMDYVPGNTE